MTGRYLVAALLAAMFVVASAATESVFAHGGDIEYQDPGYGMGYSMQSDSMDEYCPGCGMMNPDGMGNGMMGHQHMGPGMIGDYGMGPGMMGGYGMMGPGPVSGLELSSEQQKQITRINTELRKHNWALQGEIIDAQGKLFELYADENPDAKKIGAVYGKIFDLRRQMIEATIDAQNRQRAILTNEQREQLRIGPYERKGHRHSPDSGRMGPQHGGQMMGG